MASVLTYYISILSTKNKNRGKKIDKGECWDLAFRALEYAEAKLIDTYVFGEVVKKNSTVYAGDIIQFENVVLIDTLDNGSILTFQIPHHTAIVYEVIEKNKFKVAEQNNGITGKVVAINDLNLNLITQGEYTIFRPIPIK